MKTLLILRHAKSSWKNLSLADIDRPLNKRGKRDAPRMGALLLEEDLVPDLIISSPAVRARKTAKAVSNNSGYEGKIEIQPDFYPGDPDSFIEAFYSIPDKFDRVMVVAHNPGLEELLYVLTGESARMPTSALAQVTLPVDRWLDLDDDTPGKLVNLWLVKELN
ncbi:MAG: histidine phosphatase family protein [Chloroflexota bacterium]|nr:MAG: histidine phosphatase family protein [Chloroflexota bacterium]